MSQYDSIGAQYALAKSTPAARLEVEQFRRAIKPILSSITAAKVLDLACGTGHYIPHLLGLGASEVVGVDLSPAMTDAANQSLSSEVKEGRVRLAVGDATVPTGFDQHHEGSQFDVVTGNWLLNYASDDRQLTNMFRTISINLKLDGKFVGIIPHATEDVTAFGKWVNDHAEEYWPLRVGVVFEHELEHKQGWLTRVFARQEGEPRIGGKGVEFRNYHLKKSIYEKSAREGGMEGSLEWKDFWWPDTPEERERLGLQDIPDSSWKLVKDGPPFGVVIVSKS